MDDKSQCRLCGAEAVGIFTRRDRYPLCGTPVLPREKHGNVRYVDLHIGICGWCGYVMLVAPSPRALGEFLYDSSYVNSSPVVSDPEKSMDPRLAQLLELLRPILSSRTGTALEIGSYDGQFLWQVRRLGWKVVGCEPTPVGQDAAVRLGMDIRRAYFEPGLFGPDSFDLVAARYVLEHVPDPLGFLRGIHACLRRDGLIVVEVPDDEVNIRNRILSTFVAEHVSYFGVHTLDAALAEAGFDRIGCTPYRGGVTIVARRGEGSRTGTNWRHRDIDAWIGSTRGYDADVSAMMRQLRGMSDDLNRVGDRLAIYGANSQTYDCIVAGAIDDSRFEYMVDDDGAKRGCLLLGSNRPIYTPDRLDIEPVEAVLISAHFSQEKMAQSVHRQMRAGTAIITVYPRPTLRRVEVR